jgi:hypothetical protein
LVLAAAAVTTVGLLYLTRRFDFYYDEWDYVLGAPTWTLKSYCWSQATGTSWTRAPSSRSALPLGFSGLDK